MDKNTITGFILIALVVIGFSYFSRPSQAELAQQARQDSIAQVEKDKQMLSVTKWESTQERRDTMAADSTRLFCTQHTGEAREVVLQNAKVKVTLNTLGGMVQNAEVKGYKSRRIENGDVMLFNKKDALMCMSLGATDEIIHSFDFYFTPTEQTDSSVTMELRDGKRCLQIRYRLIPDSYMLDMTVQGTGMGDFGNSMRLRWEDHVMQQEKGYDFENRYSSLTYKRKGESVKHLKETSNDSKKPEETLDWVAFKNQFFSAVILSKDGFTDTQLTSTQEEDKKTGYLKTYTAELNTKFDPTGTQPTQLQMYLGPNEFRALKASDKLSVSGDDSDLEELVYLGWWIFRYINRWFIMPLFNFLSGFGLNLGIVLLLLTIIVKVLVYPTNKKSYVSSAKMRVLKPQIDALSEKYPKQEDAMKKQQEMMQIYSQYGVSPMGGCLPMLIQMPIWLALFNFVPNAIAFRGVRFLWAEDLSAYDSLIHWNKDLWLIGDHLSIFCVLFCLTNIINTWISMRQQQNQMSGEQAQQMKMMQYMMYIMPLMFFFMFNTYSSGLCYYYFLSGLTSILIMWYLRKSTDDAALLAKLEAYKAQHKNDPKKTSGMAARLEALQKMQEEQQKRLNK